MYDERMTCTTDAPARADHYEFDVDGRTITMTAREIFAYGWVHAKELDGPGCSRAALATEGIGAARVEALVNRRDLRMYTTIDEVSFDHRRLGVLYHVDPGVYEAIKTVWYTLATDETLRTMKPRW